MEPPLAQGVRIPFNPSVEKMVVHDRGLKQDNVCVGGRTRTINVLGYIKGSSSGASGNLADGGISDDLRNGFRDQQICFLPLRHSDSISRD